MFSYACKYGMFRLSSVILFLFKELFMFWSVEKELAWTSEEMISKLTEFLNKCCGILELD